MAKPTIIIVGADKGGVGKTMISRVLLDYLKDLKVKPIVWDTEGALHRFYAYAKPVDIDTVAGQAQIFDSVPTTAMTVVDLKAGTLSNTLRAMRNAGLLTKSDSGNTRLIVMHVLGSSKQSMDEIIDTNALLAEGGDHVLIENHAAKDGTFFKWDEGKREKFFEAVKPTAQIVVPHLDATAAEDVDLKGMSFYLYIVNAEKKNSDYLTRVVRHWRDQVYGEFNKMHLVDA